ncbi:hypothetical protein SAMN05216428_105104 [Nitrosospira sp. Nsp11]|nr:hypothetical protein SAMN05216428_105104 [Nitrosospira sp. Nsp11]
MTSPNAGLDFLFKPGRSVNRLKSAPEPYLPEFGDHGTLLRTLLETISPLAKAENGHMLRAKN